MNTSNIASTRTWYQRNAEVSLSSSALMALAGTPIVFLLWLLAQPGGPTARLWFDDITLFVAAAYAALACVLAARRYGNSPMGRAWMALGLGLVALAFGEGSWGVQELFLKQEISSPGIADIGYLAFYPIVFFGLFTMPQAPVTGIRRLKLALEIAICIGAVTLLSVHFLIEPLLRDQQGTTAARALGLAYPIGDVAVVFATLIIAMRGRNHASYGMVVLAAGFAAIAFSDSAYTYLTELGNYHSGSLIDTGWVVGYALIAAAGLITAGRRLDVDAYREDTEDPMPLWQTVALQLTILPVAAVLFFNASGDTARVDLIVLGGFVMLGILASGAQALTQVENLRLNRQLEQMTLDLKGHIQTQRMRNMVGDGGPVVEATTRGHPRGARGVYTPRLRRRRTALAIQPPTSQARYSSSASLYAAAITSSASGFDRKSRSVGLLRNSDSEMTPGISVGLNPSFVPSANECGLFGSPPTSESFAARGRCTSYAGVVDVLTNSSCTNCASP